LPNVRTTIWISNKKHNNDKDMERNYLKTNVAFEEMRNDGRTRPPASLENALPSGKLQLKPWCQTSRCALSAEVAD
jgi:hypothetical protein